MTDVVAKPCFDCIYTDCVVVCPVECFYQSERMHRKKRDAFYIGWILLTLFLLALLVACRLEAAWE